MRTDRTERLLNLVLCLLGTRRPVSRASIRSAVPGYQEAASDEAFERMFERDKDELRAMGIPMDTVISSAGEVEGYRIDTTRYAMPEVSFTGEEIAVLGLAARAWNEAALQPMARDALLKIEALGDERATADDPRVTLSGRPAAGDVHLPALWEAVRTRTVVRFLYQGLRDDDASLRTVEPWGTVSFSGAWYVVGLDRDRGEPRAFRLSRVAGSVSTAEGPGAFPGVAREDVQAIAARWAEPLGTDTAEVDVDPDFDGSLRLRATRDSGTRIDIPFSDAPLLAAEIAEQGARVRLIAPVAARALVVEGLAAVARAHGDAP
ncbi:MAG: helix-turn-helix transcriptional regulator [Candidatus Nanopelagicales bacterium]